MCSTRFSPSVNLPLLKCLEFVCKATNGVEIKQSKLTTLEFLNAENYTGNMCHLTA